MNSASHSAAQTLSQPVETAQRSFLKGQWYAAAWSDEIVAGGRLARTILAEPLVIWRAEDGSLSAMSERCPHRFAPLSMGKIEGYRLSCPYHGLTFDGRTGRCIGNPHGPVTAALNSRAYPVIDRHNMLWIWMGTPADATADRIPELGFIDAAPIHAFSKGYMHAHAGHHLLEDNILDLSHADFLHPHTLGGGSITRTRPIVEERGDNVFVQWLVSGEPALPIFRAEMPTPDMPTDMWTEVLWHPNGVMTLRGGATPAGESQEFGIDTWNAHIMTPETANTTHYFYCNSRNYKVDDPAYNATMASGLRAAFETEDKPVIEAQQRLIGDHDLLDLKPALLSIDSGSTRARRSYARLLAREHDIEAAMAAHV